MCAYDIGTYPVVDLIGDDNVVARAYSDFARHPELIVPVAQPPEAALQPPTRVKNLDPVVVGVADEYLVLGVDRYGAGVLELPLLAASVPKHAVEGPVLVEDLDAVVPGVCNDQLALVRHGNGAGLVELPWVAAEPGANHASPAILMQRV